MNHLLEIDSVQFEINTKRILSNVYLKCQTGMITGLLGRNGSGKSSLMKIIFGSLPCESSVRFDNKVVSESYKYQNLITLLPQFNFIPPFLEIQKVFNYFQLEYSLFQNIFPEFTSRKSEMLKNLSGGERRLIELYVILKSKSKFALLDEPFTHLNPHQIDIAKQLIVDTKPIKGLLITDHLYMHILDICDSLYILYEGKTYLTNSEKDIEVLGYARL